MSSMAGQAERQQVCNLMVEAATTMGRAGVSIGCILLDWDSCSELQRKRRHIFMSWIVAPHSQDILMNNFLKISTKLKGHSSHFDCRKGHFVAL